MGDFDDGHRTARAVGVVAAVAVTLAAAAAVGLWIGRTTGDTAPAQTTPVPVPMEPPWTATTPTPGPGSDPAAAGTVDAGQGWALPDPGAAGPFSVTDHGVPFGYRQDRDGAALAAVNAVVAGRYLAGTFADPWAALGFLADPQYAARGGNPALERFFTGPVTPTADSTQPAAAQARPVSAPAADQAVSAGGGRVIGARVAPAATPAGAMQAVVLWQSFSREYRPDGRTGYTVRIEPVSLLLVWAAGDWKVSQVGRAPQAGVDAVVVGVVPASFPVPAESWHR